MVTSLNSNIKSSKLSFKYLYFIIICLSLFVYAIFDMQSSTVTGNGDRDRGAAHFALVVLIALNLLFFVYHVVSNSILKVNSTTIILLLITVWIALNDLINDAALWNLLTHCGMSALWFFDFIFFENYFSKKNRRLKPINQVFCVILCFYAASIIYYMILIFADKGKYQVSNLAYNLLVIYPFLMLGVKNEKKKIMISAFVGIFMFVSLKRGAIIAFCAMTLFNWICTGIKKKMIFSYLLKIFCIIVFFACIVLIIDNAFNGALVLRFTTESLRDGSGRSDIYRLVISLIKERDFGTFLIGTGSGSSIWGTGAHNEWLEFTYTFGFIGVILYFLLIFSTFYSLIQMRKRSHPFFIPCSMMFLYVIIVGMVGGVYFMQSSYFVFALFGLSKSKVVIENGK